MKFRDGYWGLKKGVYLRNPVELRDTDVSDSQLTLYSATKKLHHRGATLNCPILTTEITSPFENVIRIRTIHYKGRRERGPAFKLDSAESDRVTIKNDESGSSLCSGDLTVRLDRKDPVMEAVSYSAWELKFFHKDKYLTRSSGRHSGHMTVDVPHYWNYSPEEGETFMCEYLNLSVGESIYGLGERFTPFVKNGQTVDIWNEDGGTASEQTYKNIPFYISNRGYGVLVNDPGRVQFEVASEVVTSVQFSVPGEVMDYYVISGDTLKDVLKNYTKLSGRPALPPPWSFGLWLTTSFTTSYDEKTVTGFIEGMAERDIPLHVFHFDCFWMKEFHWVDFQWDREQFPDPEGMLTRLKSRGLNICVWINPYIAQKSPMFDEGMEKGYLVMTPEGHVWQWDKWQAGMGLVDFTNPEAVKWYKDKLRALIRQGVDTFKTDFGERIPTDVVYHDGSDPAKMHNYYTYLYNKTVFELLEEELGENKALVFARSATVGGQKFPVHWGGDCAASYESMAETLRGGLSLALSGFGFWSHDISGFELTATPDLYKRWIAFGSFSSHSRLHGNESYRVPWNFDEESCDVLRFFTKLKCTLMPYIFSNAVQTHKTGVPMMRPIILEHTDDPTCPLLDRQYYFGDSIMAAPLFDDTGEVTYYLPAGGWTHLLSGQRINGGCWRTEKHDYFSLPLMVPDNSIILTGDEENRPDYDYGESVTVQLFGLEEGHSVEAELYDGNAELLAVFHAERSGNKVTITREDDKTGSTWKILFRMPEKIESAGGQDIEESGKGPLIAVPHDRNKAEVVLQ